MARKTTSRKEKGMSGAVCVRAYYRTARSEQESREIHIEPESAFDLLTSLVDDKARQVKRLTRLVVWVSWQDRDTRAYTAAARVEATGPFGGIEELDETVGALWESMTVAAQERGLRLPVPVRGAIYQG